MNEKLEVLSVIFPISIEQVFCVERITKCCVSKDLSSEAIKNIAGNY